MAKKRHKPDREERIENVLRPCPYLGYDRDDLGLYFSDKGAFELAESQFRRAVWVNPFEPEFKVHLAECLYRRHEYAEAAKWVGEALDQSPSHEGGRRLQTWITERSAGEPSTKKQPSASDISFSTKDLT